MLQAACRAEQAMARADRWEVPAEIQPKEMAQAAAAALQRALYCKCPIRGLQALETATRLVQGERVVLGNPG